MVVAAKKTITKKARIQLLGSQARPGPALASYGINMAEFTKQFNDKTKTAAGVPFTVEITAFSDKSFSFIILGTPVSYLIKKELKIEKGGKNQLTDKVGELTKEQALKIANQILPFTNAYDENAALNLVAGTCKQMGVTIKGVSLTPKKDKSK
ncbi:MAG: 50S ribosomal protein L11 [Mycoplasmataceae bacterium]|nr:50S ribosomal protein L11 [Mycoplasmataceae bacterium]